MGAIIEVKYFNSFILKKINATVASNKVPVWNGSPGIPGDSGYPIISEDQTNNWAIEEARIRGGFNNTNVDYGVKAYLVEDEPNAVIRGNSLIYSGIFNSRTGVNNTNVFSVGEDITKSADPANGTIQKLYAEDTNLIIFQESKVSRALIDKDAIYSAEGGGSITNINTTIGTIQPFGGNFGISRDPGSFATYGYRKYFTDKDRNAVLRLSMDGLTEISNYGMYDYFRDDFSNIDTQGTNGVIIGGWDIHNKQYVVSTKPNASVDTEEFSTLSFDESVKGWTSFFTYNPDQVFSMRNNFYTMKDNALYKHYSTTDVNNNIVNRGSFYGITSPASVSFIFNPSVSLSKVFNTVNYEGSNGWQVDSFVSDSTGRDAANGSWILNVDSSALIRSYDEGIYTENGVIYRAGFVRKENKYNANLVNNSTIRSGEVLGGQSVTGIKGYFADVTISTDGTSALSSAAVNNSTTIPLKQIKGPVVVGKAVTGIGVSYGTVIVSIPSNNSIVVSSAQTITIDTEIMIGGTNPGGSKELFAVSSNYSESSY